MADRNRSRGCSRFPSDARPVAFVAPAAAPRMTNRPLTANAVTRGAPLSSTTIVAGGDAVNRRWTKLPPNNKLTSRPPWKVGKVKASPRKKKPPNERMAAARFLNVTTAEEPGKPKHHRWAQFDPVVAEQEEEEEEEEGPDVENGPRAVHDGISALEIGCHLRDTTLAVGTDERTPLIHFNKSYVYRKPKLTHRYKGPDPELANMLFESNVLNYTTGVRWDDVAGLSVTKRLLYKEVVVPRQRNFQGNCAPTKGVLMFGPPGSGKTLLAKAVATASGTTLFNVSSALLTSEWRGESMVRCLFDVARAYAPSTIFIDEIDSLCLCGVSGELLRQIDGVYNSSTAKYGQPRYVTVLAATEFPWDIDKALRQRFAKHIYIPLPDFESRKALINVYLRKRRITADLNIDEVARGTEGYSGDDLTNVCRDAAMNRFWRKIEGKTVDEIRNMSSSELKEMDKDPVTMCDFMEALVKSRKSVSPASIEKLEKWMAVTFRPST